MAQLNSPGVSVTVVDESFYTPSAAGTVPLIFVATEENKQNSAGTGIAAGTLAANAGQVYLMTSQRDISDTFGTPIFKTDANNNPVHAGEQNEYGLHAAYSYLGVSNRAYIVRADVDLKQLTANPVAPAGQPNNGDWWFDVGNTNFGVFEWDSSPALTGGQKFNVKYPMLITELSQVVSINNPTPKASLGAVGSYAVVALTTLNKLWFKKPKTTTDPQWVEVGSEAWVASRPAVKSAIAVLASATITGTDFTLVADGVTTAFAGTVDTVGKLVDAINALGASVTAAIINGRLELYTTGPDFTLSEIGWNTSFGITIGTYRAPTLQVSKHTEVPEWKVNSPVPRPSGSVWIKTTYPNLGANWIVKTYNAVSEAWSLKSAPLFQNNTSALVGLNPTGGGRDLEQDAVYVKYNDDEVTPIMANFKIYTRKASGATSITSAPLTTIGTYKFKLQESVVGSTAVLPALTELSTIVATFATTNPVLNAEILANAINSATSSLGRTYENIVAVITSNNRVVLSHVLGGEIKVIDVTAGLVGEKTVDSLFDVDATNNLYSTPISVRNVTASATDESADITVTDISGIEVGMTVSIVSGSPGNNAALDDTRVIAIAGSASPYTLTLSAAADDTETIVINFAGEAYTGSLWTAVDDSGAGFIPASFDAPTTVTSDGQLWYNSDIEEVDILINTGSKWVGYQYAGDLGGANVAPYYDVDPAKQTDPNGPLVMATAPTTQSDGTALVNGDIWVSTADEENYPVIYMYDGLNTNKWVELDKTDQTSENGVLFADARWTAAGEYATDEASSIAELLVSDYVDFDVPDPALYPKGMLLWNLRRSGFNVKRFVRDYIDVDSYNTRVGTDEGQLQTNYYPHRWVSAAANQEDGSGSFGRKAQRGVVVQALQAAVNGNQEIRDEESRVFNLIACPGYPELIGELVSLNYDRQLTAFVVGDTPARLVPTATNLLNWGTNQASALEDGDRGLVSFDEYLAVFYPWGYTSDNLGNNVVVPPSHMILRTIALSDNVSYPWFAPAGTRRGGITNATSVGYVDSEGEFRSVALNTGLRDTLASIKVNPITFISGSGLVNFGQYTRARNASALDRINVARLVVYLRRMLTILARPYVFEPNDKITRDEFKGAIDGVMLGLVGQRALYDFITVCDQSNNTPARIDRSELWADVAIEPVKASEFIYIPLRLKNTGEIAGRSV